MINGNGTQSLYRGIVPDDFDDSCDKKIRRYQFTVRGSMWLDEVTDTTR